MRPFDQDAEESEKQLDEKEKVEEGIKAKVVRQGYSPTQKEIDEHVVTHTRHIGHGAPNASPVREETSRTRPSTGAAKANKGR